MAYTRFNGNPWVVRERNGLREYKQLDITPDKPGPQVSHRRGRKRARDLKGKKRSTRRPSSLKVDDDSDSNFTEALSIKTRSKRAKRYIDSLRNEVGQLQNKRDKARRNLEEQSKTETLEVSEPEPLLAEMAG